MLGKALGLQGIYEAKHIGKTRRRIGWGLFLFGWISVLFSAPLYAIGFPGSGVLLLFSFIAFVVGWIGGLKLALDLGTWPVTR